MGEGEEGEEEEQAWSLFKELRGICEEICALISMQAVPGRTLNRV